MDHNINQSRLRVVIGNDSKYENMGSMRDEKINRDLYDMDLVLRSKNIVPENDIFLEMLGKEVLLVMTAHQLSILGQTFRPIFCGTVVKVTNGFITLNPAIVKMSNAPFFCFPTPLSFPMENITHFLPFDCNIPFPIS